MDLPEKILQIIDAENCVESQKLAEKLGADHQKIVGGIKSLESLGDLIESQIVSSKVTTLTSEGCEIAQNGSHEMLVYAAVPREGGIPQPELNSKVNKNVLKIGFSKAMSQGWISMDKSTNPPKIMRKVQDLKEDAVKNQLVSVQSGKSISEKERSDLKKRKLIQESTVKTYKIKKGKNFSLTIKKPETDLTAEMIQSGDWKTAMFKPYNFDALGIQPPAGHLHPLLKVRAEYRQIFLEMGFSEMPTNNFVESSFWNFDALFQPQQHPARDAHDTFFIQSPAEAKEFPQDYLKKVKEVHSHGGFGSQGYGYDWKIDEAQKNLLRTHTTAVSARMLYALANQEGGFKPQKYFSIDRVFRNETLDATHLAEFHQIEGVVADVGLNLGNLIGILYEFFNKLGIKKLRFKPAYNPYTEPSMEIFSYHEGLKKWVEIGNSGVFRPEMLLPMGLPENVNVIAWGLSLERPTMIMYGIDNIRSLCGNKVDLKMVKENPICRL